MNVGLEDCHSDEEGVIDLYAKSMLVPFWSPNTIMNRLAVLGTLGSAPQGER
jgi:hypothetical protein